MVCGNDGGARLGRGSKVGGEEKASGKTKIHPLSFDGLGAVAAARDIAAFKDMILCADLRCHLFFAVPPHHHRMSYEESGTNCICCPCYFLQARASNTTIYTVCRGT